MLVRLQLRFHIRPECRGPGAGELRSGEGGTRRRVRHLQYPGRATQRPVRATLDHGAAGYLAVVYPSVRWPEQAFQESGRGQLHVTTGHAAPNSEWAADQHTRMQPACRQQARPTSLVAQRQVPVSGLLPPYLGVSAANVPARPNGLPTPCGASAWRRECRARQRQPWPCRRHRRWPSAPNPRG